MPGPTGWHSGDITFHFSEPIRDLCASEMTLAWLSTRIRTERITTGRQLDATPVAHVVD
ncbi:hypothetical protein EST38_g8276 [Candolleomyces aberdarensis]|uniref:Uncharacterized protein n=1 Tax=Candolleomyces aberdarensis TaxID=2316362 RepID=A0A4Q2DCX1_9AGAR|nr:hypothetical protein EST38_g8276 [Candolleomyces aberdarensis]